MAGMRLFLCFLTGASAAVVSAVSFLRPMSRFLGFVDVGEDHDLDPPVVGAVGVGVVGNDRLLVGVAGRRQAVGGHALAVEVAQDGGGTGGRPLPVGREDGGVDGLVVGV